MPAKPELLAPAGDWECVRAAVANGADAIYFGLPRFNARLRAENFTEADLPRLMDYLHARGVRGYVAFNTLIFTGELPDAEAQLRLLQRCRVDAAIVQDLGLVAMAREVAPDVEIHASTQMTLTSPEGVRFARRLGITRVVLARELSLRELAKFREPDGSEILPTEVFVHGALCVAYSGQCLTSEALGQRSANRGECAQACRLPYEMVVDGVTRDLGDRRYLLSPQDLAAVDEIPELVRLGVRSFKIEGRLKTPEYVAAVTKVYRAAIDAAGAGRERAASVADRYALEMTFSRGQFSGWMHGVDHQQLVHGRFGKKRGVDLGRVARVDRDAVELFLTAEGPFPVKPGDGVVFDTGEDTDHEQGGRVFAVRGGNRLEFERGRLDSRRIPVGARVWKTSDPALDAGLRATFAKDPPPRRRPLDLRVSGRAGEPLRIVAPEFPGVEVVSEIPLVPARNRPLTPETLREQLARLGETAWELHGLDGCGLEGPVMLPISELNRLRRELVDLLPGRAGILPAFGGILPSGPNQGRSPQIPARPALASCFAGQDAPWGGQDARPTQRHPTVLCRTLPQIEAALAAGIVTLYADFEDIRRYRDAVALVRSHPDGPAAIFLATPRIQKAGETGFFKLIETAAPDGVLVRNLGGLDHFREHPTLRRIGDFSLNVANPLTAAVLLQTGNFERLTVSPDLNAPQVLDLLRACPPGTFEITVHQHLPMFHMEHCVFAAFLSEGKDHLTCGRPCDRHEVKLRDRVGAEHPVKADVGCRNTVFQSRAQSGAEFVREFREAGAGSFRVELLNEDRATAERVLRLYAALLTGETAADRVIGQLRVNAQLGVTRGTLAVGR